MEITTEYVLDGASAWKGEHREHLRQALDDARAGRYDVLLVWALDRLSHEGIAATLRTMRQLADRGVHAPLAGFGRPGAPGCRIRVG
jgi:DNA invertase Pin-like site-specific DNA recombinase